MSVRFVVVLPAIAIAVVLSACSSSSTQPAASDGGVDTVACSALASYRQACGATTACTDAYARDCARAAAPYSAFYLQTLERCVAEAGAQCDSDGAVTPFYDCFAVASMHIAPTAAEVTLARDYCTACRADAAAAAICMQSFYAWPNLGTDLAIYNDGVIGEIDQACVPRGGIDAGAGGGCDNFEGCILGLTAARAYTPPECH